MANIIANESDTYKKEKSNQVKPFIRWAGGKQNLVGILSDHIPKTKFHRYFEPFLGAGSLFLYNNFPVSYLSDINPHLINSYISIRDNVDEVNDKLLFHKERISKAYYYELRDVLNRQKDQFTTDQAAIFIFLVHTSFNGIYRVNKKGEYNVPFGKSNPALPNYKHLLSIQEKLNNVVLRNCMYEDVIKDIKCSDFVYFDPPYPSLNSTSYFQHYSINKFPDQQQIELSDYANYLSSKGVFVMLSNAETPMITELYKGWNIKTVSTYRFVNCKAKRKTVNELIITNY